MEPFGPMLPSIVVPFIVAIVISLVIRNKYARGMEILKNWAWANNLQVRSATYRNFLWGPFQRRSSSGQAVFRVRVTDQTGKSHRGWVRCGGHWSGLKSERVSVKWDWPGNAPTTQPQGKWWQ